MSNSPPAIALPRPSYKRFEMGDLYWNPTDLTTPSGYGTYLGSTVEDSYLATNFVDIPIQDTEDYAAEIIDELHLGHSAAFFFAVLAEHTSTAYQLGFNPYNLSNKAGFEIVSKTSTGKLRSTFTEGKLLHVPYDRTNHNCCLLWAARPRIEASHRMLKKLQDVPTVLPIVFKAFPNASGKVLTVDLLTNLSLV